MCIQLYDECYVILQYYQDYITVLLYGVTGCLCPHCGSIGEVYCMCSRLVFKCRSPHLNANANAQNDSNANANAQHFNQMQMQMQMHSILSKCKCKCATFESNANANAFESNANANANANANDMMKHTPVS